MQLPRLAINNYQFTIVIVLMLSVLGIVSYRTMPKSEDPYVEYKATNILVVNPGSSPEDMETLVANPIEEAINELAYIKTISTEITDGVCFLFIEFEYGNDYNNIHREIVQKVNEIRDDLPETIVRMDVDQPSILDVSIMQLAISSSVEGPEVLKTTAKDLKQKLESTAGVRAVEMEAERSPELSIVCDLEKMAHYNLSLGQVMATLQSINRSIPGGSVDIGNKQFNVLSSGLFNDLDAIRNTVLSGANSHVVYLKDVAKVEFDYEKENVKAYFNDQPTVWLSVRQKKGVNIYDVNKRLEERIEAFKGALLTDVEVKYVFKQADSVSARIGQFSSSFLQGILLVGLIVMLAVGFRASVVVIVSIPLSILTAIGLLDFGGYGLQQMSIAGLIIALGMLVDNSIAIVENIYRFIKLGYKPVEAAVKGASEIGLALISSTATTVLAFAPMLMMGNDVGDFIKTLVLIVIYALLASLFIALTFAPFISSRVLKKKKEKNKKSLLERFITNYYKPLVKGAIKRPVLTIAVSLVVFIGSIALMPYIGVSFFPKAEKNQLLVNVSTPEGSNLSYTEGVMKEVSEVLKSYPEVDNVAVTIGEGNPIVYYNMMTFKPAVNKGQLLAVLDDYDSERMHLIIKELRQRFESYSSAQVEVKEFAQGPPVNAPIEVRLFSDDMEQLKSMASDVELMLRKAPAAINVNNPIGKDRTALKIKINYDKAGMLGVGVLDIDMAVRAAVNGLNIGNYQDALGEDYDIILKSNMVGNNDIPALDRIFIPSHKGGQIPLSQVADIAFDKNIKRIDHYDLERYITVTADVDENIESIAKVTSELMLELEQYDFPNGTRYMMGGEQESRDESFGSLGQALIIALLGIFAVLVLQFKSFSQPLIIFSAIPLSISGAFVALFITGYSFSFMAFVGLTSLMGIVINSSIILVDYANQKRLEGSNILESVVEAAQTRFTPILLTTITTVGGLLPLTLRGGDMWAPMGWAIIGGLILSTGLTLVLVPVLYNLLTRKK
ncbi:efflux RND transporter permease subunit [Carboxylicivirga sp. N1Y90]|uniref:efflux RND transporter permease subunit n=1 Tax=Carboxylicivirga fragile TaxID=3417571 RepID=UPI003D3555F3|nr:efflux RND transporter permease subunit [Marinilabiliaceae bacterium N1Y90]